MAEHRLHRVSAMKHLTHKQIVTLIASAAAAIALITGGIASTQMYKSNAPAASKPAATAYSATQAPSQAASRSEIRTALAEGRQGLSSSTSYVRVIINGHTQLVFGTGFSTVKSVLQQANITLEPEDRITPSLNSRVTEKTVINISRSDTSLETKDTPIPFNTITKNDPSLPKGTTKVQTQGQEGIFETTNLVQRAGSQTTSTNSLASWVKKAPVNKVVLVGTKVRVAAPARKAVRKQSASSSSSPRSSASQNATATMGTTMPVGQAQQYASQQVSARGWDGGQFTCLVQLWQRESGWSVTAHNASGAYGIPQALPGSKMGPGWQSDATVQINWGLGYIAGRYGTPCGAWAHSQSTGWY
jgi:hypothetical protein